MLVFVNQYRLGRLHEPAANYVDLVVDKDVTDISRIWQREMLPRLLGQLAARSGQVLNITAVAGAIGLERSTAENYVKLLEAVFLVHRLPAWGTTLGSGGRQAPQGAHTRFRRHGPAAQSHPGKIMQADPSTLTEYGHLLERFAVGEILKQVSWSDAPVAARYFRSERGDEVDLVLERDDGQVIAFEIKAGTRVGGEDLHGLRLLKERLGHRLQEAVILCTGQYAYRYEDWAWVLPLSQL
jgi:uncharacterized protein